MKGGKRMGGPNHTMSIARKDFKDAVLSYRMVIEDGFYCPLGEKPDKKILKARVIRLFRESPTKLRQELLYLTLRTLTKTCKPRRDPKALHDDPQAAEAAASLTIQMRELAVQLVDQLENNP